jgi:lysophospholipase L1-like esterase
LTDAESNAGGVLLILRAIALVVLAVLAGVALVGLPAAAVDAAFAGGAVAGGAATPAATRGLAYVALGDSYAAGYGLADPTGKPAAGCAQSALDYPHRVATLLGLDLTDVSCSGATTANVVGTPQGDAAPQVSALGPATQVVTVSIGGNDADLFGTSSACIALGADGPLLDARGLRSCSERYGQNGTDSFAHTIDSTTATGLHDAFAAIRTAAPHARVFVVGYPAVFPDSANTPARGCFRPVALAAGTPPPGGGFPFTSVDTAFLAGVQTHLDRVVEDAAHRAGFTYVDTLPASLAHSACATGSSYIEGVTVVPSTGPTKVQLAPGALHPNGPGTAYLADEASRAIASSFAAAGAGASAGASAGAGAGDAFLTDLAWIVLAGVGVVCIVVLGVAGRSLRREGGRP